MSVHNGFVMDLLSDPSNSTIYPAIEDIEHPAWISTTSFSESCGSCFSRCSSFRDNDFSDVRTVPSQFEKHIAEDEDNAAKVENANSIYEEDAPYTASGSLQSVSSSSKTIYASPRSNSENQFISPLSRSALCEKAKQRRGSLYRERAPSENALDFSNMRSIRESKLSHSLHDVSSIPSNGLKNPAHRSNTRASLSALYSRNRSRDSGFLHSGSLLSLNSGSHNYNHVESKVKQYIQNIKDADALRKRERAKSKTSVADAHIEPSEDGTVELQDGPEVIKLLHKLQHELQEKDRILIQLNEDYHNLMKKYAEASNKIDKLRLGCGEGSPPVQETSRVCFPKFHPLNRNAFKSWSETPVEVDDSSFTSAMFLSQFETMESPDSSLGLKDNRQQNSNQSGSSKKEVVVSAPLRPISSLYCTSVRLDRVMTPLTSKSSSSQAAVSSTASSRNPLINTKKKKSVLNTTKEGTTDTGIDSFCPLSTEGLSTLQLHSQAEPIGHLPHEDSILKVQRWQKSLPTSSRPGAEFSPCSKSTSKRDQISNQSVDVMKPKIYSSIGIQVNQSDAVEFPSSSSRMSTPVVPCLNLGELSGCTEDISGSLLSSEWDKNNSRRKELSVSVPSTKLDSSSVLDYACSMPSKSFTSSLEVTTSVNHRCDERCQVCGSNLKSGKKPTPGITGNEKNQCRSGRKGQSSKKSSFSEVERESLENSSYHLKGPELTKLMSLIWKDQDHVVPASPEEERSFQDAFQKLERKMNALKSSVNLQTFVSLLDVLMEKVPKKECKCLDDSSVPNGGRVDQNSSLLLPSSEEDCSLLQCLEEVDNYTHQVWAKTESFLQVLNSTDCKP